MIGNGFAKSSLLFEIDIAFVIAVFFVAARSILGYVTSPLPKLAHRSPATMGSLSEVGSLDCASDAGSDPVVATPSRDGVEARSWVAALMDSVAEPPAAAGPEAGVAHHLECRCCQQSSEDLP